jgi:feruloyl esterase
MLSSMIGTGVIMIGRLLLLILLSAVTLSTNGVISEVLADSPAELPADAFSRCEALGETDFSRLQDAPSQITDTAVVEAQDRDPAYCRVQGYVWPQVGFELRLPLMGWNGKFVEVGCGGNCGTTSWTILCPVHRGYACIASDMGHRGKGPDMLWAYHNLQAQFDLYVRGPHVVGVAGKAITASYYGKPPSHAYFMGCSSGGLQALSLAQRFPYDFDGIIGLCGSPYRADLIMYYIWAAKAFRDENGASRLDERDLQLVHDAALAACDKDDGVQDGIISDPYHCDFDPAQLQCRTDVTQDCLTTSQVEAVRKVYSGPMTSERVKKTYMRGLPPGTELGWTGFIASGSGPAPLEAWVLPILRYMGFDPAPGPDWTLPDFDFDRDYERLGVADALWSARDPDLRRLKAAGAKLIYAYGLSETGSNPAGMIDYYQTVERVMGGRASTQEFFRLFMVPGMDHCGGGAGASAIDYLTYMEDWVEHGRAPDKLIGAHVEDRYLREEVGGALRLKFPLDPDTPVAFTRPVFPYPTTAKYNGQGNPHDAANFKPVDRP